METDSRTSGTPPRKNNFEAEGSSSDLSGEDAAPPPRKYGSSVDSWGWYDGASSWNGSESDIEAGGIRYPPGAAPLLPDSTTGFESPMRPDPFVPTNSDNAAAFVHGRRRGRGGRATYVPDDILEQSLASQALWHFTAGIAVAGNDNHHETEEHALVVEDVFKRSLMGQLTAAARTSVGGPADENPPPRPSLPLTSPPLAPQPSQSAVAPSSPSRGDFTGQHGGGGDDDDDVEPDNEPPMPASVRFNGAVEPLANSLSNLSDPCDEPPPPASVRVNGALQALPSSFDLSANSLNNQQLPSMATLPDRPRGEGGVPNQATGDAQLGGGGGEGGKSSSDEDCEPWRRDPKCQGDGHHTAERRGRRGGDEEVLDGKRGGGCGNDGTWVGKENLRGMDNRGGSGWGDQEGGECQVDVDEPGGGVARATVLLVGHSPFASSVTKTFSCGACMSQSSLMVRVPRFRVVRKHAQKCGESSGADAEHGNAWPASFSSAPTPPAAAPLGSEGHSFHAPHAEFLVVVSAGAVTFGVWRRFTHFKRLAESIGLGNGNAGGAHHGKRSRGSSRERAAALAEQFRMTHFSWAVLERRKRLFRCLERDYLAVKCFLLERFLHDLVFESTSPHTISDFLDVW